MAAEDSEDDLLIEFLPIKKKGIHPRMFIVHDITGMATPFMRLGAYMPNETWAIGDKYFGSVAVSLPLRRWLTTTSLSSAVSSLTVHTSSPVTPWVASWLL